MSGATYVWLGGSNTNDAATLANWGVVQNGATSPAAVLPGTGDTVTLSNGGLLNDSAGDLSATGLSFAFAGSGGTLAVGNVALERQNQIGGLSVAAGATGTLLTTGTVADHWQESVAGPGATLDVQVAAGTLDMQNAAFALQGGVINIGTGAGATLLMDGGLVADGGTVNVAAGIGGSGILVAGGGGTLSLRDNPAGSESIAFIDNAGTLVLGQAGTLASPIFGFQQGDAIDLTALNEAALRPITVNANRATLTDGTSSVVLFLPDSSLTAGSFVTSADAQGHVLLGSTQAGANWLNGASGDWATGAAWSTGTAPGAASNVVIGNLANSFVVTATNEAAQSLMLLAPNGTLAVAGSLAVGDAIFDPVGVIAMQNGGSMSAAAFVQLAGGGTLDMANGARMTLRGSTLDPSVGTLALLVDGTVLVDASTIDATAGTVVVGDTLGGNVTLQNHGTITAAAAVVTAMGTMQVQDGGVWSVTNGLTIGGGNYGTQPVVMLQQGTSLLGGALTVGGALAMTGGTLDVFGGSSADFAAGATLNGGGQITLDGNSASVLNIGTPGAGGAGGVVVDAGATLTLANGSINAPTVTDNGVILDTGNGVLQAGIAGTGRIDIAAAATLMLTSGQPWSTAVDFTGAGSTLILSDPAAATGAISIAPSGAGQANTIDINTLGYNIGNSVSYDAATGGLLINNGGDGTLHVGTGLSASQFSMVADAGNTTAIVVAAAAPCYAAGTRLATPGGEVAVEDVQPGDAVLALHDGAWQARRVRWVGRVTVDLARHPDPARAAPIRIRAGAFADGQPRRDLLLSPEHGVFVDGVLMQAQALLNGATVTRALPARVTYLHVELDRHAVLCAEGLPAESYLDTGNRAAFSGTRGVRALHPDFATLAAWDDRACAALVLAGPLLEAARTRLRARAIALGFALTAAPALAVEADGALLRPDTQGPDTQASVRLPAGTRRVRLISRHFVPAWLGLGDDRRQLGVAVARLGLDGAALPEAAFGTGWHVAEPGWRWTDGAAELLLPPLPRPAALGVTLAEAGARYWTPAADAAREQAA